MLLYLELCVDLKEHRGAKDGLHQYRNMSQQHVRKGGREGSTRMKNGFQNSHNYLLLPSSFLLISIFQHDQGSDSLEKVIVFYVDLAERKMNEARKKADAAAVSAASAKITDLENDLVRREEGREGGVSM